MDEFGDIQAPAIDRGGSQSDLRRYNERVVLSALRLYPGMFNAELARRTGLAAQTVSVILRGLAEQGLVRRGPVLRGRRGQPATPIFLDPDGAVSIGCEIGWRHCTVLVIKLDGEIIAEERRFYDYPDPRTLLDEIGATVARMIRALPAIPHARGMGLGLAMPSSMPDVLDKIGTPPHLVDLWRETDAAARLHRRTGLPVSFVNDGTAACSAEGAFGRHQRHANFVHLFIGAFIGAGLMMDGRIVSGPTGNAANLGAMVVLGRDGQPSIPHWVAGTIALQRRLRYAGLEMPGLDGDGWDRILEHPELERWLDDAGYALAQVVINTSATIEFDTLIVDGVLPRPLVARLIERIGTHMDRLPVAGVMLPRLVPGALGIRAAALGAAGRCLHAEYFALTPEG